jgi:hypothetical protein
MAERSKTNEGIQKQLGHKNLNTTQIYIDYFDDGRKREFGAGDIPGHNLEKKIKDLYKEIYDLRELSKNKFSRLY